MSEFRHAQPRPAAAATQQLESEMAKPEKKKHTKKQADEGKAAAKSGKATKTKPLKVEPREGQK